MIRALASFGPAIANHLWQSTLFAAVVWLTTLLLRINPAQLRYSLWLAASLKFLIPFSLLIALGGLLPSPQRMPLNPQTTMYVAVDSVTQPFPDNIPSPIAPHTASLRERFVQQLPIVIAAVWLCGALAVLLVWIVRWRQIYAILRNATIANVGREHEISQRLGSSIPILKSQARMEPGIFGILYPVLIWPEQLSESLDDQHIEAILSHELIHVKRRDNLTAALHMLVEAVFWFHPLVWWIETRMVEERERACDEAVVQQGGDPEAYAESLLKACRFCIESPMACVSGVTGADLSRRMRSIMSLRLEKLNLGRKVVLAALSCLTVAAPIAFGIVRLIPTYGQILHAAGPLPSFEVATIKPWKRPMQSPSSSDPSTSTKVMKVDPSSGAERGQKSDQVRMILPIKTLIESAYNLPFETNRIAGGPGWLRSETDQYEIHAKIDSSQYAVMQKMSPAQQHEQVALMEQSLLADRFGLKLHFETREMPGFALVVAKGGPRLTPAKEGESSRLAEFSDDQASGLTATAVTLDQLIHSPLLLHGRPAVDQTGLKGSFDFTLKLRDKRDPGEPDSETSVFTAIQEQLGLKLISSKASVEVLVIDRIEKPKYSDEASVAQGPVNPAPPPPTAPASAAALPPAKSYTFEVVSIHQNKAGGPQKVSPAPDGYHMTNMSLAVPIATAYVPTTGGAAYFTNNQTEGYPDWILKDRYDIDAKISESDQAEWQKPETQKMMLQAMLRAMFEDRLKLVVHRDVKEVPVYALVVGKSGPKFKETNPGESHPGGVNLPNGGGTIIPDNNGEAIHFYGSPMKVLAPLLSNYAGRPVQDNTGLTGKYDFVLQKPAMATASPAGQSEGTATPDPGPSIFSAVQDLGLRLDSTKGKVETLVIDKVERPSEN